MIWFEELQTRKRLSRIYSAYETTFPEDERRDHEQFLALLENPDSFIFSVKNDETHVGYVILWKLINCYYLEHFEVFEEFRNLKLGTQVLTELQDKFSTIILESEPSHLDEMAERRINFYLRNGFSTISQDYIQPSYGPGKNSMNLFLLSNFAIDDVKAIKQELYQTVYGVSD